MWNRTAAVSSRAVQPLGPTITPNRLAQTAHIDRWTRDHSADVTLKCVDTLSLFVHRPTPPHPPPSAASPLEKRPPLTSPLRQQPPRQPSLSHTHTSREERVLSASQSARAGIGYLPHSQPHSRFTVRPQRFSSLQHVLFWRLAARRLTSR